MSAHRETTGAEIWDQTSGRVRVVVCSVGTGGTVCGVGAYLKDRDPSIELVAVEPYGSTIFGGTPSQYLNTGAGLSAPSTILRDFGHVIDYWTKVPDSVAITTARRFAAAEGVGVGITSGMSLVVAEQIAQSRPNDIVVAISPDGAESYQDWLRIDIDESDFRANLCDASSWRADVVTGPHTVEMATPKASREAS